MGMSAEGELGMALWQDLVTPVKRIVLEHEDELVLCHSFEGLVDIAS